MIEIIKWNLLNIIQSYSGCLSNQLEPFPEGSYYIYSETIKR